MKHVNGKVVVILNAPPGAGKDTIAYDDEWGFEVGDTLLCDYYVDNGDPCIDSIESISFKYGMFEVLRPILTVGIGEDGADEFFDRYQDRDLKEQPWDKLGGMSPRQFMIFLSENFMKVAFGKEVFGKYTAQKVKDSSSSFIILSDGGFAEEIDEVVKAVGAENVYIFQWSADGCSFNGDSRRYLTRGDVADGVRFVMLPHNTKQNNEDEWRAACLQRVQEYVEVNHPALNGGAWSRKLPNYPVYEDGTTVYLLQEDSFEFELSLGDIIDDVMSAHHEPGDTLGYWKGELKRIPNNRFVNAQAVLSQIESAACDEIAEECVDDFLSCVERQEAMKELSSLLSSWADKWMTIPIYEVKNVTWVDYDPEADE